MGLFKTTASTYNTTLHVSQIIGSDTTGNGSRENPYATITKALSIGGSSSRILLNGVSVENVTLVLSTGGIIAGDSSEAKIIGNISGGGGSYIFNRINVSNSSDISGVTSINNTFIKEMIINQVNGTFNFINKLRHSSCASYFTPQSIKNTTVLSYYNAASDNTAKSIDNIVVDSVDLYNTVSRSNITAYPIFQNCLFRKATLWKWNGATITINWANNPVGGAAYTTEPLMQRVYNALLYYANNTVTAGTDRTYAQAILATQATMFQDCVVYDDSDTVNNPIFSKYVGGVPVDYTLALKSNNPALYISTIGSYVGCYAANVNEDGAGNVITFGAVKHVDTTTGVDTATTPDLLVQDPSNPAKFSASQSSLQLWNRIRTSVIAYPRGKSFAGMQSQLDSGLASRLFFGKRQEIRTSGDINQKTTAFESVEVLPYDSIPANNNTTQNTINNLSATLPRFSAPFNGECLMFYKGGVPLTFGSNNELRTLFTGAGTVAITSGSPTVTGTSTVFLSDFVKDDNIRINSVDYKVLSVTSNTVLTLTANTASTLSGQSYSVGVQVDKSQTIYGAWAVTNADIESYSLLQKATKAGLTTSIPLIKYAKFELNLHYDEV